MYGIKHESVSDFALRKVLGIGNNSTRHSGVFLNPQYDTYMNKRLKIKSDCDSDAKYTRDKIAVGALIATCLSFLSAIIKKKPAAADASTADKADKGIFNKCKSVIANMFKSNKS